MNPFANHCNRSSSMRIVIRVFPAGVFKTGPRFLLVKSQCFHGSSHLAFTAGRYSEMAGIRPAIQISLCVPPRAYGRNVLA